MSPDEEKQQDFEPVGFADVAAFIAGDKEHSGAIYRRFERLAARDILYLQSELHQLELRQEEFDREDAAGDVDAMASAMEWQLLRIRGEVEKKRRELDRLQLAREVREKVKEYQETVLRNVQMLQLARPSNQVHKAFDGYFNNRHKSPAYPKLAGLDAELYGSDLKDDLVALVRRNDEDRLTIWLREQFPKLFTRHHVRNSSVASLSDYRLGVTVGVINVIVAAGMLFGAIFNLYYVQSEQKRLGLIAGYTVAFALCISLVTNARRSEIFAACAAYAAVLVVFVSGNLGG